MRFKIFLPHSPAQKSKLLLLEMLKRLLIMKGIA